MEPIRFGASGWRAILGERFTFANVRVVRQAIAEHLRNERVAERGVLVGYDAPSSANASPARRPGCCRE